MLLNREETAVSPVVAVIFMVAITVILSAVVGLFALDLGQSTTDRTAQQELGVTTTANDTHLTTTVLTGEADELRILVNGTVRDSVTNPRPGDTVSARANDNSTVSLTASSDDSERVVSTHNPYATSSASYNPTAPTAGLTTHWMLNESSGDAIDYVGTDDGTANVISQGVTVDERSAYEFDGSDDTVALPDSSAYQYTDSDDFTISAWVRSQDTDTYAHIVSYGNAGGSRYDYEGWRIRQQVDGTIQFLLLDTTDNTRIQSSDPITEGQWHHISVAFDATNGTMHLYIDGEVVDSESTPTASIDYSSLSASIGDRQGGTQVFDGYISDVRLYDRALGGNAVRDLYDDTK